MSSAEELALTKILAALTGTPCNDTFFRSIDNQYMKLPLSAVGSIITGGRYNRIGSFEALYVADNQITALREVQSVYTASGKVVGVKQPPRTMLSIQVSLQAVVDLRTDVALNALSIQIADLLQPWKIRQELGEPVYTQRLGAAARRADIEALIVPSARARDASNPDASNLVVIMDRVRVGSSVELYLGDSKPNLKFLGAYTPSGGSVP